MSDYYTRSNTLPQDHPNYDPTPGRSELRPGQNVMRDDFIQYGRVGSVGRAQRAGELEQMLMQQAMGQGPSLAQMQLQRAGAQAMAQQQALAAGARPGYGGMAQRMAAQNSGRISSDLAEQAALLRLREQMEARGMLAQMLAQQRGLDIQQAGTPTNRTDWTQVGLGALGAGVTLGAAALGGPPAAAGAATVAQGVNDGYSKA